MNPAVMQYLDASTAHLPERERADLEDGTLLDNKTPRVIAHEYGWWVNVPEDMGEDAENFTHAPALLAAVQLARKLNCNWINFDADASLVDGLEAYE